MTNDLSGVRQGYDRWAPVYDHDLNPMQGIEQAHLHRAVGDVHGQRVLDLGCGTGRHSLWLAAQGADVVAVDFSAGMLAEAKKKPGAERVEFVTLDLTEPLPYSAEFDLVVSGLVLEHLQELEPFFTAAFQTLKPGGRAVISGMHPAMFLRGAQARFTDPETDELVMPGSLAHSVSAFVMAAVKAGFQLEEVSEHSPDAQFSQAFPRAERYIGWPMLVLMQLRRA
ncbi:class I SAM-dependent methyltransferase [Blastopirellula sp. JC732]|uniref:Class I SAM-dependent methyltransferase n=1 Tax=Blastopirellula sediminis TaxID=2894196 RepID=A0A9X1SMZ3_9BACT|nr:class I SAM-dependent methyltransferase [Blastopirellula sediminis]MCC9604527.1 class I SAM-dependent methyltransferase [Blastopirellula sediminis]MCC9632174.1 class I SAM-dependent methyltransferase [Blastopirellula sediminis]